MTGASTGHGLTLDVTVEPRAGLVRLVVAGELDVGTARLLDDALRRAEESGHGVEVDLTAVSFADCGGARPLVEAARRRPGAVGLRHPRPLVARVLAHLGLPPGGSTSPAEGAGSSAVAGRAAVAATAPDADVSPTAVVPRARRSSG